MPVKERKRGQDGSGVKMSRHDCLPKASQPSGVSWSEYCLSEDQELGYNSQATLPAL